MFDNESVSMVYPYTGKPHCSAWWKWITGNQNVLSDKYRVCQKNPKTVVIKDIQIFQIQKTNDKFWNHPCHWTHFLRDPQQLLYHDILDLIRIFKTGLLDDPLKLEKEGKKKIHSSRLGCFTAEGHWEQARCHGEAGTSCQMLHYPLMDVLDHRLVHIDI